MILAFNRTWKFTKIRPLIEYRFYRFTQDVGICNPKGSIAEGSRFMSTVLRQPAIWPRRYTVVGLSLLAVFICYRHVQNRSCREIASRRIGGHPKKRPGAAVLRSGLVQASDIAVLHLRPVMPRVTHLSAWNPCKRPLARSLYRPAKEPSSSSIGVSSAELAG